MTMSLVRHPAIAATVCLLATFFAVAGLPKLKFDDGLSTAFRSDYPAFQAFEAFRHRFSITGTDVAVHLSAEDFAEPQRLEAVRDFVLELGTLRCVDGRTSIFGLRTAPGPDGKSLFPDDLGSPSANREALSDAAAHPLNRNRLITASRNDLLVAVRLNVDDQTAVATSIDEIDALARAAFLDTGIEHRLAGVAVLRARVIENITRDQTVINAVGAALGLVLCLIMFRRVLPALNAGLPAVIALVWVLGFLGHSGIGINTLTNTLPVLIMVLAFADSMHLTYETQRGMSAGLDDRQAIANALRVAGPPCLLTSLTTGIAFASLLISHSELVRSLAFAGLVAVAITFVVVIVINPLVALTIARLTRNRRPRRRTDQPLLFPTRAWGGCLEWLIARGGLVSAAGGFALVAAVALHSRIEPHFTILENVNSSAPELADHNAVEKLFLPLSTVDLTVSDAGASTAFAVGTMERLRDVHQALVERFGDDRVTSFWSVAEWLDPERPELSGPLMARLIAQDGGETGSGFVSTDGRAFRVSLLTPELDSPEAAALANTVRQTMGAALSEGTTGMEPGGLLAMSAAVAPRMIGELNYSFLAAAAMSGLVIGLWCRRFWVGVVALVVNVLPISLAGAWLTVSGSGLQFASGLALTIAFGIAVDDTIHVFNRLRPALLAGRLLTRDDLRDAFTTIAPVLLATTIILVGGLASALLSAIPTIVLFAQISMAVLAVALVADLLLLPALLSLVVKWQSGRATT